MLNTCALADNLFEPVAAAAAHNTGASDKQHDIQAAEQQ